MNLENLKVPPVLQKIFKHSLKEKHKILMLEGKD